MNDFIFKLPDSFVAEYEGKTPPFGYVDAAGTALGEIVFARTYSRRKDDGTKESWTETCRRVVEFVFSVQKRHCQENKLYWNGQKALASAKKMMDHIWNIRFTPPGRGLFSATVENFNKRNSSSLNNCTFISSDEMTRHDPARPFKYVADMSMLGVGCGFDTKGSDLGFTIKKPTGTVEYVIEDSREGWVESIGALINAFLIEDKALPVFDYSKIRAAGTPIKGFGGVASGPQPLIDLHEKLVEIYTARIGEAVDSRFIVDTMNLIGVCVVSGNVRRSALVAIGESDDEEFIDLKNYDKYPERASFGWMSNNSVFAEVGQDLSHIVDGISRNGEPGVAWLELAKQYGRLKDAPDNRDYRVKGGNPCMEILLESYELCNLSELYLNNISSKEELLDVIKSAYLYAKSIALMPTHVPETNAVMLRNRRIGLSVTGVANFVDNNSLPTLRGWLDTGYDEVQRLDKVYSEWLCVRESIKTTTVKPSGSVSILGGASPGVHWTVGGKFFVRRITFSKDDPMVEQFRKAGYPVIDSAYTPKTSVVVEFPVKSEAKRSESEVSIFEKIHLAAELQQYWSDNSVSVTISYNPETETDHIGRVLHMYEGRLKTVSFLPMGGTYEQMPYEQISEDEYEERRATISEVDMRPIYGLEADDAVGENYCTTDRCELPSAEIEEDVTSKTMEELLSNE